jgi:hypothetical protein
MPRKPQPTAEMRSMSNDDITLAVPQLITLFLRRLGAPDTARSMAVIKGLALSIAAMMSRGQSPESAAELGEEILDAILEVCERRNSRG